MPQDEAMALFDAMRENASSAVAPDGRSGRFCPGCTWNITMSSPAAPSSRAISASQRMPFVNIDGLSPSLRISRITSASCGWSSGSPPVTPTVFTSRNRRITARSSRMSASGLTDGGRRLKQALHAQLQPRTTSRSALGTLRPFQGRRMGFIVSPFPCDRPRRLDGAVHPRRQTRNRTVPFVLQA